ncbi:zinc finger protein 503 [Nematostella vectensis]|uniref:zinc finger protein 503 n=1 Tax=Nematostella vectensis TaxID=45351 RepID=UPI0020771DC3|nr:zinc finger protein 503 [Nematostella vectensis]
MPTRTFTPVALLENRSTTSRAPLEALQMLTQSVAKCGQEYIQPLPLKEEEQKKSPLALLAATCSSIGKTEPTKTAETDNKNSLPNKINSDDTRSSFKPYQHSTDKTEETPPEKTGFRSPSLKENPPRSPVTDSKDKAYYADTDPHCRGFTHSPSRTCAVYMDPSQSAHAIHKDCGSSCPHPASVVPFKGPYPLSETAFKTHGIPTSVGSFGPVYPGQCACAYCTPHGEVPPPQRGLPFPHGPSTPYMDYLQRTVCREPNCTNCKPLPSTYGMPGAGQCGPHCMQCDSMKAEQSANSPFNCFYPHGLAMFKGAQDEAHPFVCNWVSGAKHCGKSFTTSEDLFQHLRSHTQLGNSVASPSPIAQSAPACNVHGCPCKLRASPVQSSSPRYRPYYYKPSVLASPAPPVAACYPSPYVPMHGLAYDPHRLFK